MNSWHDDMSRISTCRDIDGFMPKSSVIQAFVSAPTISPDLGTNLNVVQDESMETFRRNIGHHSHAYSARSFSSDFGGYRNNRLSLSPTPSGLCSNSTYIGFINFDRSMQLVPSSSNHPSPQFVKPLPCSVVAPKAENSLQAKSAGSVLLTGNKPHGEKPNTKRFVSLMKQCSCSNGSLAFALSAQEKASPHQGWIFRCYPAGRAPETFRPSKFSNILEAVVFGAKPVIKFLKRSRVVSPGNRVNRCVHEPILQVAAG